MKVKKEDLKKSKIKLTVEIEPKELVQYFRKAYEKVAASVNIDGFRPGKAPYKVVEAAAGHNRLYSEGIDTVLKESYPKALKENKIIPISQPKINIKKTPNFSLDVNEIGDSLVYEVEIDIMPKVEMSDYKSIKVEEPKKKQPSKEDIEKIFKHLRTQKATFKDIDRVVKLGDRIEINFEGSVKGVKKDKLCSKNHPIILGEGNLIPNFEKEIVGMKNGQDKKFKIKFPKNYGDKEIADREVEFNVKLIDAKEVILPKLSDEFAKDFGQKSLSEMRKSIKNNLAKEYEAEHKKKLELLVVEKVLLKLKVIIPETLIESEIGRMIEGFRKQIKTNGLNFEKYLVSIKKTVDDIKKDMRTQAEKNVRIGLMLGKIIEEKKYNPSDKESSRRAIDYLVKTVVKN